MPAGILVNPNTASNITELTNYFVWHSADLSASCLGEISLGNTNNKNQNWTKCQQTNHFPFTFFGEINSPTNKSPPKNPQTPQIFAHEIKCQLAESAHGQLQRSLYHLVAIVSPGLGRWSREKGRRPGWSAWSALGALATGKAGKRCKKKIPVSFHWMTENLSFY